MIYKVFSKVSRIILYFIFGYKPAIEYGIFGEGSQICHYRSYKKGLKLQHLMGEESQIFLFLTQNFLAGGELIKQEYNRFLHPRHFAMLVHKGKYKCGVRYHCLKLIPGRMLYGPAKLIEFLNKSGRINEDFIIGHNYHGHYLHAGGLRVSVNNYARENKVREVNVRE